MLIILCSHRSSYLLRFEQASNLSSETGAFSRFHASRDLSVSQTVRQKSVSHFSRFECVSDGALCIFGLISVSHFSRFECVSDSMSVISHFSRFECVSDSNKRIEDREVFHTAQDSSVSQTSKFSKCLESRCSPPVVCLSLHV